jgi:serine/threonine protein phosphatase 1
MFKSLFGKKEIPRPAAPEGQVLYAIGDVHGRADLLVLLLEAILEEAREHGRPTTIIGLGDYVDRGPGSREVLELLAGLSHAQGPELRLLRGNHEETLLRFLEDASRGAMWCSYGGRETLQSYGVEPPEEDDDAEGWEAARVQFAEALPDSHRDLLKSMGFTYEAGDYFFCHAGARPGVRLSDQTEADLLWIRGSFLDDKGRFDKIIVHGHSVGEEVQADHRRIGVDTGAYATGALTAVKLEGKGQFLLQTVRTRENTFRVVKRVLERPVQ